jgi:hypothetical protein
MTEAEWNQCADVRPMLNFLRGKVSARKLRLFAVECCRRVLASRPPFDEDLEDGLLIAEELADGLIDQQEAQRKRSDFESISALSPKWLARSAVSAALDKEIYLAAECAAQHAVDHFGYVDEDRPSLMERILGFRQRSSRRRRSSRQCVFQPAPILREVFGNPFRPVTIAPVCRTSKAIAIAQAIYDERRFTDNGILAGALEDAGCDHPEVVGHLRNDGEHCRGCWATDLVLGKQ